MCRSKKFILSLVQSKAHASSKKKSLVCEYFSFVKPWRPMTEFEFLRDLYLMLNVKKNPRKHWTDSSGWEMVGCMHKVVLQNT